MRQNRLVLFGMLLALAVLLFVVLSKRGAEHTARQAPTPAPASRSFTAQATPSVPAAAMSATPPQLEKHRQAAQVLQAMYSAPIEFYGRAEDQFGDPVAGATVEYSALDKFSESGTKYQGSTDAKGLFSLTGVQGAALSVAVWKEGYDGIYKQSNGAFAFGVPFDSHRDRPTPAMDNPAVFVLRKKAPAERLITVDRDIPVPRDGTPVEISLRTANAVAAGQGDLRIECWTFDEIKDRQGRYEWRCRLSVPDGGLVKRQDVHHSFQAPEEGSEQSVEVNMAAAAKDWRRDHDDQYWAKLRDGTYARMRLRLTTGGGHFVSIVSFLNPSGLRNLELDPALQSSAE